MMAVDGSHGRELVYVRNNKPCKMHIVVMKQSLGAAKV